MLVDDEPRGWYTIGPLSEANTETSIGTGRSPVGTRYEVNLFNMGVTLFDTYPFESPRLLFLTTIPAWSPYADNNFQVTRTAEEPDPVTARLCLVVTRGIRDIFRVETLSSNVPQKRDYSNASAVLSVRVNAYKPPVEYRIPSADDIGPRS